MYIHINIHIYVYISEQTSEQRRCQPAIGQHRDHKNDTTLAGREDKGRTKGSELIVQAGENERTENCLCCGSYFDELDTAPNYHHFRYSKDWNDDTWENLIIVCEDCHESIHCYFEHDSEHISLRTYMLSLLDVIKEKEQNNQFDVQMDDLWCDAGGHFSITQNGMTSKKTMKVEYAISNQTVISFFERRRDHCLEQEKKRKL